MEQKDNSESESLYGNRVVEQPETKILKDIYGTKG